MVWASAPESMVFTGAKALTLLLHPIGTSEDVP